MPIRHSHSQGASSCGPPFPSCSFIFAFGVLSGAMLRHAGPSNGMALGLQHGALRTTPVPR